MTQHQPKGSMCQTCSGGSRACATLPFASMPVIKAYPDGVKAVKCSAHQPAAGAPLPELRGGSTCGTGRGGRIALRSLSRIPQSALVLDWPGQATDLDQWQGPRALPDHTQLMSEGAAAPSLMHPVLVHCLMEQQDHERLGTDSLVSRHTFGLS